MGGVDCSTGVGRGASSQGVGRGVAGSGAWE